MQTKKTIKNTIKTIIMGKVICYFLLLTPIEVYGSWQDYREGKKTITYEEILKSIKTIKIKNGCRFKEI